VTRAKAWVGVDAGKEHHWAVVVDHDGTVLLSRRVANDERAILELLAMAGELADELVWAVDLGRGYSALLLAAMGPPPAHQEGQACRPRLPQLRQLPPTAATPLRRHVADSPNRKTAKPLPTLRGVEPL
jgi:Transposase